MIGDVINGLIILQKYSPKSFLYAEHDIIMSEVNEVNQQDAAELDNLGWHLSDEYDCWCCFV